LPLQLTQRVFLFFLAENAARFRILYRRPAADVTERVGSIAAEAILSPLIVGWLSNRLTLNRPSRHFHQRSPAMNRCFARVILAVATVAIASHVPEALAAKDRPFKLSGSGQSTFNPDGTVSFTMSGTATHLGHWTAVGVVSAEPTDDPTIIAYGGPVTFTAANGDQLEVMIEDGKLDITTGVAVSVWQFVGGTGRFSDVTGSAAGLSHNPADGSFDLWLEGSISY